MQTLTIDTNGIVKKLEQRSFSRTQAEGITEALKELDASTLVTKSDRVRARQSNGSHQVGNRHPSRPGRPHLALIQYFK
jgi:hypothetical protein